MNNKSWLLSPIFLALVACSGGSDTPEEPVPVDGGDGGGDVAVSPLDLPDLIEILQDSGDPTPKLKSGSSNDFENDPKRIHIWDEAMQPLSLVNEILCYVSQTGAEQLVNETYTALVDTRRCRSESGGGENEGQGDNAGEEYQLWTIESTRQDNDSPQIVKIWVPSENESDGADPMDSQRILVEVTINSEGDESTPYGQFVMNWKGEVAFQGQIFETMQGTLQAALDEQQKPKVQFFNHGGSEQMGFMFEEATTILLDSANASTGVAKTGMSRADDYHEFSANYSVAFDDAHYLRAKLIDNTEEQQCLSRTDFDQHVWRYNLYDNDSGSRVDLNSGFPFYADLSNGRVYGHVGYYGMWLPDGLDYSQITTIFKHDYNSSQVTEYSVTHGPGKLMKRVKSTVGLSALESMVFHYDNYQVEYSHDLVLNDGTEVGSAGFYAIAVMQEDPSGQWELVPIPAERIEQDYLHLWSESLGGEVVYNSYHDPDSVTVFEVSNVRSLADIGSNSSELQLDCYFQCPKSLITSEQINYQGDQPYLDDSQTGEPTTTYGFDFASLSLVDAENNSVSLIDGVEVSPDSPHFWGLHSGVLLPAGTVINDFNDIWSQEVSYFWETGQHSWNRMSVVSQAGSDQIEEFDRPMQFVYSHSTANDLNASQDNPSPFNGQSFMLSYGGVGDLWGIPHQQVNDDRYLPLFSLKDGTLVGDDYKVKGTEVEKRLREVELNACSDSGLSLAATDSLSLPDNSALSTVNLLWSDKPEVTEAPRVIGGIVQY